MSDVTILQADRFLMVDTPLGADKLKLTAFEGEESMSRLFSYRLQMFSEDEALDPKAIDHCMVAHMSAEPGHRRLLDRLGRDALFDFGMRLGEASGAALAITTVKAAVACHADMATFAEAGVSNRDG